MWNPFSRYDDIRYANIDVMDRMFLENFDVGLQNSSWTSREQLFQSGA